MFRTDLRQVFDFIRCSKDKKALKELIESDPSFRRMEEDAFDVMVQYAKAEEMLGIKDEFRKEGKIDMCKGLADWIAEERAAGKEAGLREGEKKERLSILRTMLEVEIEKEMILKAGFTEQEIENLYALEETRGY